MIFADEHNIFRHKLNWKLRSFCLYNINIEYEFIIIIKLSLNGGYLLILAVEAVSRRLHPITVLNNLRVCP